MDWEDYKECKNYVYEFAIIYLFHLKPITSEMKDYFSICYNDMRYYEWEHEWE